MSFDIAVELLESTGGTTAVTGSFNRRHTNTNIFRHSFITGLSLARRALCIRRLKLLKLYMAAIVIFIILFFLLRSNSKLEDDPEAIKYEPKLNIHLQKSDSNIEVNNVSDHLDPISYLVQKSKFPDNLTHPLSALDFNKSKVSIMQVRIREAMKHSWDSYRRYAWGYDMLKPRSKEADHWFNLGLTIIESTDTLMIMGLTGDSKLAIDWIENELNFTSDSENSNCFELTIRILGGILSAYHLTGREKLKQQAITIGDILLKCYNTESQIIPYSDIDLKSHRAHPPAWNPHSSLAEVATIQLEYRYLSQISENNVYEQTTFRTSKHLHELAAARENKLLPMYINPTNGQLEDSIITVGARADSYYEYLLKQYLQTGIKWLEGDYLDAVDEIKERLLKFTNGSSNFTYVAEMQIYKTLNDLEDVKYFNKMDHLVCFLPGTLVLGYYHFSPRAADYRIKYGLDTPAAKINPRYDHHLMMAKALARTCHHMYNNMGTGLSPEIATFVHATEDHQDPSIKSQPELQVQSTAAHNLLRPEFVESLFYLYHITGLPLYRVQASQIFESFQKYSRIQTGYTPVSDVRVTPPPNADLDELLHRNAPDRMDSFWLSETLKYLYLTFCDDNYIVSKLLNSYVFNTEGHMLPIL